MSEDTMPRSFLVKQKMHLDECLRKQEEENPDESTAEIEVEEDSEVKIEMSDIKESELTDSVIKLEDAQIESKPLKTLKQQGVQQGLLYTMPVVYQTMPMTQHYYVPPNNVQDFWSSRFPFYMKPRTYSPDNRLEHENRNNNITNGFRVEQDSDNVVRVVSTNPGKVLRAESKPRSVVSSELEPKHKMARKESVESHKTVGLEHESSHKTVRLEHKNGQILEVPVARVPVAQIQIGRPTPTRSFKLEDFRTMKPKEVIKTQEDKNNESEEDSTNINENNNNPLKEENENIVIVQPSQPSNPIKSEPKAAVVDENVRLPRQRGTKNSRSYACKFCDKDYMSLGALKMHIRTHTLPCQCTICGKSFSRPWLLQGHIRTHTGERPFACSYCGRAFADRSNLRAHIQTHSDLKKFECGKCYKTFSRGSLLARHEEIECIGPPTKQSVL